MKAFTESAESQYSNVADVTTGAWPEAPTGLVAWASSDTQIELTWTDNSSGADIILQRSEDGIVWSDVTIIDNLSRRAIDGELGIASLTPIEPLTARLQAWREVSGRTIDFRLLDVAEDYAALRAWLATARPDAVVHLAEQRAAPYSMKSSTHKRYTVDNNINATNTINGIAAR